jgi:Flp pilus assembly protein TadD
VELDRAYSLAADGPDVYRNFVIRVPVEETRYVKAVELHPGNPRIVHHGRLLIDRTSSSRGLDAREEAPGWDGMSWGNAETPDGILLGWTPGKLPMPPIDGFAWRLDRGTDIVLQLHMIPSGKPESIRPSVGLYLADGPPTLHPLAFVLGSRRIDIPAGEANYPVTDEYVLPIDVELLGIYPHGHYLATKMHALAELPDGSRQWLLRIDRWDFDWQDEYRYASPVALPRGTRIVMEFAYDNSAANVRNPSNPPRRVRYGAESSDEMAELMLNALPRNPDQRAVLETDLERRKVDKAIAFRMARIEADPDDGDSHAALGSTFLFVGRDEEAVDHLRHAVRIDPQDPRLRNNLGYALRRLGRAAEAIEQYRHAVRLDPDFEAAHFSLANALLAREQATEAAIHYREMLRIRPDSAEAHSGLAAVHAAAGDFEQAVTEAEAAAALARGTALADKIERQLTLYRNR